MNTMMKLLREAINAGDEEDRSLDYRWRLLNSGAKRMPDDDLSMDELERRCSVVYKATLGMMKIMDDLMKEKYK